MNSGAESHAAPRRRAESATSRSELTTTALLQQARAATTLPVLAIGGINPARVPEVMAAGADGVAVISAVMAAPDFGAAASELLAAVARA